MSRTLHLLVRAASYPPVGNPCRHAVWVSGATDGPLIGASAVQVPGRIPHGPYGMFRVGTGPREDRPLRVDLTIPVVGRVDRAASGFESADQTGMRL